MLFALAWVFLDSIMTAVDLVPIKTWNVWNFDRELSGAQAMAHANI
jgi:hypothetical protein